LPGAGKDDDRAFGSAPAEPFKEPDALDAAQFNIDDAGLGQAVCQQRLRLFDIKPMEHAVMLGIDGGTDRFGQVGMFGEHQQSLHGTTSLSNTKTDRDRLAEEPDIPERGRLSFRPSIIRLLSGLKSRFSLPLLIDET
jgi:hypothetical protein